MIQTCVSTSFHYCKGIITQSSRWFYVSSSQCASKKQNSVSSSATFRKTSQKHLQQQVINSQQFFKKYEAGDLQKFSQPKNHLNNVFQNLQLNFDPTFKYFSSTNAVGRIDNNQMVFQCTVNITWPSLQIFHGYAFRKKTAEAIAHAAALDKLYTDGYLNSEGHAITMSLEDSDKIELEWDSLSEIHLSDENITEGYELLKYFKENVEPNISKQYEEVSHVEGYNSLEENEPQDSMISDLMTGKEWVEHSTDILENRNISLLRNQHHKENHFKREPYTIDDFKDTIISSLENRVLIIAGDTGCGKSTQMPQFILDSWIKEFRGSECNIVVTQPRRISAIALAKRIAKERHERIGYSIGYHVRLGFQRIQERGGIMFCTTGMLLQGFHSNPKLKGISHVIIDEVHERSVQTDLLLILLRRLLKENTQLSLVLMSASISTQELMDYFKDYQPMLIEIPGMLYPLTRNYLPDSLQKLKLNQDDYELEKLLVPGSYPQLVPKLVIDVIEHIHLRRDAGAILVFLPGWQEIRHVQSQLEKEYADETLLVVPVHSRLSSEEQEKIFEETPNGKRKVVLATNIAETSLTIDDVVYVVDTGLHKELRYSNQKDVSILSTRWISQANAQQRAGRAGRVQPGEVFHLYSQEVLNNASLFPVPELLRISLEHVLLMCKSYCGSETSLSFLSDGLDVPSHKFILKAVRSLERLGMLQVNNHDGTEVLTALGSRIVYFSTAPQLSKAIVFASIFKCLEPVLSICTLLSTGQGIFRGSLESRSENRLVKVGECPESDLLALYNILKRWENIETYNEQIKYCNANRLSHRSLLLQQSIKGLIDNHLLDAKLCNEEEMFSPFSDINTNSHNGQLILGVMLAGVDKILQLQKGLMVSGIYKPHGFLIKTVKGENIKTVSDSVLHKLPETAAEIPKHLLAVNITRDDISRRTVARDISLVQPLTVVLFAGKFLRFIPKENYWEVKVQGHHGISFKVQNEEIGTLLVNLREVLMKTIDYIVETRGLDLNSFQIDVFSNDLIDYVQKLLIQQNNKTKIDNKK
ncbi:unnamed protein product [Meganyctiphanes norvegica]|uniref:RNA helicase n=1 Tax=Meganyctiphanes norvegica TaxID=48144 RepID=A0AAV2SCU9_MEGNR